MFRPNWGPPAGGAAGAWCQTSLMTAGRPNTRTHPRDMDVWNRAIASFMRAGWTRQEWDDLYEFLTDRADDGARFLAAWLRNPPARFVNPISPALVRDVYARHPKVAEQVMIAIGAGATERFAITFIRASPLIRAAIAGWQFSRALGLAEPAATGWAATGYLHDRGNNADFHGALTGDGAAARRTINAWVDAFGPGSYLYVLAGITLKEAVAMRAAGDQVSDQQLRVMAALNGYVLPAGI